MAPPGLACQDVVLTKAGTHLSCCLLHARVARVANGHDAALARICIETPWLKPKSVPIFLRKNMAPPGLEPGTYRL